MKLWNQNFEYVTKEKKYVQKYIHIFLIFMQVWFLVGEVLHIYFGSRVSLLKILVINDT